MTKCFQVCVGIFAAISLAGSAGFSQESRGVGAVSMHAADSSTAVAAGNLAESSSASQLILGAADIIHVNVWKTPELSQTLTVGPDGFISLPLLGDVHVAGMTTNQLAHTLTTKLGSYIMNPQVVVSVVDIRSRQVYILGEVGKPGGYPLVSPVNVLQLIAQAGGLSTYANRKGIVILRSSKQGVQKIRFNYNSVVHGDVKQNVVLQPGDTVVVP